MRTVPRDDRTGAAPTGHGGTDEEPEGLAVALALHGLWQPVATLRALAVALTEGWPARSDDERLELARSIERETVCLRDVAEDLSTLGLLDRGAFVPLLRTEGPLELLRDAAAAVEELGGRLRVHAGAGAAEVHVQADRGRVLQVLKTFLRRAEKGSSEDTTVVMRADVHMGTGGDAGSGVVRFAVGYDGDDLDGIVEPFGLRDGSGSNGGGSRLRIHLARRLIEAQGGQVEAGSDRGRSTLAFTLPVEGTIAAGGDPR
jgi:signal transduction histidine kinase